MVKVIRFVMALMAPKGIMGGKLIIKIQEQKEVLTI